MLYKEYFFGQTVFCVGVLVGSFLTLLAIFIKVFYFTPLHIL